MIKRCFCIIIRDITDRIKYEILVNLIFVEHYRTEVRSSPFSRKKQYSDVFTVWRHKLITTTQYDNDMAYKNIRHHILKIE